MKKLMCFVLCLLLLLCIATTAFAVKPGGEAVVYLSLTNNSGAATVTLDVTLDEGLIYKSSSGSNGFQSSFLGDQSVSFICVGFSPCPSGTFGSVKVQIAENAAPGTYNVSVSVAEALDVDGNEVKVSVSGGSVTVESTACSHTWNSGTVTTPATCTSAGVKTYTCTSCSETKTESIPASGHDEGAWVTVVEPTCSSYGAEELQCTKCGTALEDPNALAPLNHIPGEMTVTTAATCTEAGEKTQSCTLCGTVIATEEIPAEGHDEGTWIEISKPTCDASGLEQLQCTKCHTVMDAAATPPTGDEHVAGEMTITTEATCTEAGEKTQSCTLCGAVLATEEIPAEGHDEGVWIVVQPATETETGIEELQCTKCHTVLDSAVIPVQQPGEIEYYMNNTASSFGPRFRDVSLLTDKWYRFTPIDLSSDGVQKFDLIGSDAYKIGEVIVTVESGNVTVTCHYVSRDIIVRDEFCTFLPSLSEIKKFDMNQMTNYPFGQEVSIDNDLMGDTKVLMFIRNVVDYNTEMPVVHIYPNAKEFSEGIEALMLNMD